MLMLIIRQVGIDVSLNLMKAIYMADLYFKIA